MKAAPKDAEAFILPSGSCRHRTPVGEIMVANQLTLWLHSPQHAESMQPFQERDVTVCP